MKLYLPVIEISIDEVNKEISLTAMIKNSSGRFVINYASSTITPEGPHQRVEGYTKIDENDKAKAVLTIYNQPDQKNFVGYLVINNPDLEIRVT